MQIFLSEAQQAVIRAAAASVDPCWRERFLRSIEDRLLGHEPDHVSDDDVLAAIEGITWAMFVGSTEADDY
jgi:hypothetical protein